MADSHAPQPDRLPPVPTQMVYAVRGTDRIGGNEVQTVVEAPDIDAARRIADQKSLEVHDITLMHPLNGAEALKAAQADPNDRFNQPGTVTNIGAIPAEPPAAATPAVAAAAPVIDSPTPRPEPEPVHTHDPSAHRPTGFAGPAPAEERPQREPMPASVAAAVILTCLGGLLYFTVVRDQPEGGAGNVFAASPHRAAAVAGVPEIGAGPTDVEQLIAATRTQAPATAAILPRSQRGPGRTAYASAPEPAQAAPQANAQRPARTTRPDATDNLQLTALLRGGPGQPTTVVINGQVLRPGESVGGHNLIQILDDSVVLERNGHLIGLGMSTPAADAPE